MKLIKLDRRHQLKRTAGYDWAFVFSGYCRAFYRVERAVENIEGHCPNRSFISSPDSQRRYNRRLYYVGLRQESTATLIMLMGTAEENYGYSDNIRFVMVPAEEN
tara:strand:- start:46 stop:360 length:315 start_codon:yes stop_codon:yes gene_type:complete